MFTSRGTGIKVDNVAIGGTTGLIHYYLVYSVCLVHFDLI